MYLESWTSLYTGDGILAIAVRQDPGLYRCGTLEWARLKWVRLVSVKSRMQ